MSKKDYLVFYKSKDPVAQCGCGNLPKLESYMNADVLNIRLFCPNCGVGTSLCPDCDYAVAVWNQAMKRHKKCEWESCYDSRGDNLATELDKVEAAIEQNDSDTDENVINRMVSYIESKISGYSINSNYRKKINGYVQKYSYDAIVKAVNISAEQYLLYEDDSLTKDSVENYLNKIGGILHNLHLSPVDKEISHVKSMARQRFGYFNESLGNSLLLRYVEALKFAGYSEDDVLNDLQTEMKNLIFDIHSWTSWRNAVERWIDDFKGKQ